MINISKYCNKTKQTIYQYIYKLCLYILKNRGYNEKLVKQQILKARKYRRTELWHSQREEVHENKLVFSITYYSIFSKLKNILSKIHLLLTPFREHSKVFENVSIIGFGKEKSLKDIVDSQSTEEGFCGPCNKPMR